MTGDLKALTGQLFEAKQRENKAKEERVAAEEAIAALVDTPERGSRTVDVGNGVKVVVKRGVIYNADVGAIRQLDIPEEVMPLKMVPPSFAFEPREYEAVLESHPDIGRMLSGCVTTKPQKVSVTLKLG